MKRILLKLLLCMVLVCISAFCLTACGEKNDDASNSANNQNNTQTGEENNDSYADNSQNNSQTGGEISDNNSNAGNVQDNSQSVGENNDRNSNVETNDPTKIAGKVVLGGVTYEISNGVATVKSCNESQTSISILASVTYQNHDFAVTSIDSDAFYNCYSLTSIEIPDSVTSLVARAFNPCISLTDITVDENNQKYKSIDGNLYSKDGKTLIRYATGKTVAEFIVPDSVTRIGFYAFYKCTSLESIEISNSVTSIGYHAFLDCISLTKVNYKGTIDGWAQIDFDIFSANPATKAGDLHINGELVTEVVLATDKISNRAFSGLDSLTSISISSSVTNIGKRAFQNCKALKTVEISDSIASIGEYAFASCPIEKATIPATACSYISNSALKEVVITSGTKIDDNVFNECRELTSIKIPNSITSIGNNSFGYCTKLESIEIPSSVTSIGDNAFVGCALLNGIIIPNSVTSIGKQAFYDCASLASVVIPVSVTSIGDKAFDSCDSLKKANYTGTIDGWVQIQFGVSFANPASTAKDLYINDALVTDAVLTTATSISARAFSGLSSLASVVIPVGVTSIGDEAFNSCASLKKVNYTGTIDQWAQMQFGVSFANPASMAKDLYINDALVTDAVLTTATSISARAFSGLSSLASIVIPVSVTSIGDEAFNSCESLKKVNYTGTIDQWAQMQFGVSFANPASTAKDLYINDALVTDAVLTTATKISARAFAGFSSLASIVIPVSVTSIGDEAFDACDSLEKVNYTGTIDKWVQIKFSTYKSNPTYCAKDLYINNELVENAKLTNATSISNFAFYNCESLKSITIPSSVASIGDCAFNGCSSLASVEIGKTVISVGEKAFADCTSLTSITFAGTEKEWNALKLGTNWKDKVPATEVICSDNKVAIG